MDVRLDVDPDRSATYTGDVVLTLHLARPTRRVVLHACEMRVRRASVQAAGRRHRARIEPRPETETVEIVLDDTIPAGQARLEIAFSARLRKDLCGLYIVESEGRRFAFSQLAATHARRFFPCFDEPALKVRFRLSVTTSAHNTVLSNAPIESEERLGDGRKVVHFAPTPPLSSYLLALAVGELVASRTVHCGATPITVWHVPGREKLDAFALEVAAESLARLERWFDLPHPYPKLDLVAVPEFEFGAMENAGAVFFRETLLLVDPQTASLEEQKRAAEVIAHELAHMWYGNLVTMAWWDDLWLNEAFATWMAFEILDAWRPEWCLWQTFQRRRSAALDADALRHTHPVHTPVASAAEAAENFDLITYEKGASVVRMLSRHLGAEVFRRGVRTYVRRHRESNAVAADLWDALGEASGQPVDRLVGPWLLQPGHPIVHVSRRTRDGAPVLALHQERMRTTPVAARAGAKPERWPVPLGLRIGGATPGPTREVGHLLTRVRERIPAMGADGGWLYANANETGFFRPHHDDALLADLLAHLDALRPIERQGLVDHQWALVRAGHADPAGWMDLVDHLGDEPDPDVLATVEGPLSLLAHVVGPRLAPETGDALRRFVVARFGPAADRLGFAGDASEDPRARQRRAALLQIVGTIGESAPLLDEATTRLDGLLRGGGEVAPDLADAIVTMAAMRGDAATYDALLEAMHDAATPQEQKRYLLALADFPGAALVDRTLALCLGDEVGPQDVAFVLIRLLENRHARERTWAFIARRWPSLRRRMPPQLGARLIAATPALATRSHRQAVARFFREHPLPASDRALRQALERFDWLARFQRHAGPALAAWLAERTRDEPGARAD